MSKPIRCFIAVHIAATQPLRRILRELNQLGSALRPSVAESLHVTLKFLGDIEPEQIPKITGAIDAAARSYSVCDVELKGIGAFPHAARPSVIWVGLNEAETLIEIAGKLETSLEPLGFAPEGRAYHPHLTLARVKRKPPQRVFELLQEHSKTAFGSTTVERVELMQSELKPEGRVYTRLAAVELTG
jgi:2'-5' RNA ligase